MAPVIQPAYLTPELAATYVGKSVTTLRRWTELYSIPTYGPGENQYRPQDLDAFMENKNAFARPRVARHKHGAFTPGAW